MDKNRDGKMTLEDLDGWFKKRAEKNPDKFTYKEGQAKGVLAKLDADKDGVLTQEEWAMVSPK